MKTIEQARRELFEVKFPIPENIWWHNVQRSYVGLTGNAPWRLYQDRFEAWCAALDAVVISLPESREIIDEGGWLSDVVDADEVRTAIESTNLGLKII